MLFVRAIKLESQLPVSASETRTVINSLPEQGELAPLVTQIPDGLIAINWAQLPEKYLQPLLTNTTDLDSALQAGPLSILDKTHIMQVRNRGCVVLVRAWEPPLGELGDYLNAIHTESGNAALVLPIDWDETNLKLPAPDKIMEWRRFCGVLKNWSVLQLPIGESI